MATMSQDLERAPLSELVAFQEKKLVEVMARAYSSELYRKGWEIAGVKPGTIQKIEDLTKLPFTTGRDLTKAYYDEGVDKVTCSQVWAWFCMVGSDKARLWIPFSKQDIFLTLDQLVRQSHVVGVNDGDILLLMTYPAPAPSDAIAYFAAYAPRLRGGRNVEIIPISLHLLELKVDWIHICRQRQPTVLFASPSSAVKLAETVPESLLARIRLGLFYEEPLSSCRERIMSAYALEPYEIYGLTQFFAFNVECQVHNGIHIWLDNCIAEIIPQAELEKERARAKYVPVAVPLTEAKPALIGEYVVTNFAEALPLIRYRTGNLVEVVTTNPCQCGRTHPKIKVIGRI